MGGLGGPLGSGDYGTANLVNPDISAEILRLVPNVTPLLAYVTGKAARIVPTETPEWYWFEDDNWTWHYQIVSCTAAYLTAGSMTLTIGDTTYIRAGDLLKCARTGEVIRVNAKDTNNKTCTVSRGVTYFTSGGVSYGSAAAALLLTDKLILIGNAIAEGGALPSAIQTVETRKYGGTQEIRDPFKTTWTGEATRLYTGDPKQIEVVKAGIQHSIKLERTAMFGEYRNLQTGPGSARLPLRTTHGLLANCGSSTNVAGALTEDTWEEFLETGFRWNSDNGRHKLFLAAPRVITYLNSFAREKIQIVNDASSYGVRVGRMMCGHGTVDIARYELFEEGYSGFGVLVDVPMLKWRPLAGNGKNLNTHMIDHGSINGESGNTFEYYTQAGLEVRGAGSAAPFHSKMYGVS